MHKCSSNSNHSHPKAESGSDKSSGFVLTSQSQRYALCLFLNTDFLLKYSGGGENHVENFESTDQGCPLARFVPHRCLHVYMMLAFEKQDILSAK